MPFQSIAFQPKGLFMDYKWSYNTLKWIVGVATTHKKIKSDCMFWIKINFCMKVCVMMNLYLTQTLKGVHGWWIANELSLLVCIFMRYKKFAAYREVHRDARAAETIQTLARDTQWRNQGLSRSQPRRERQASKFSWSLLIPAHST